MNETPSKTSRKPWVSWLLTTPVSLASALILFASLRARVPLGVAVAGALLVFPVLPLTWHLLAERKGAAPEPGGAALLDRLAWRSLALGVLVCLVSLSNLGPRRLGETLSFLVPRGRTPAAPPPVEKAPRAPEGAAARDELEAFIPPDAKLVVALSDPRLVQRLLSVDGLDSKKTLSALEKCQISLDQAALLVAARDPHTRMVVLRAPGITEQRNLYCLVGFLGKDRLSVKVTSEGAPLRFEVEGLLPGALRFQAIDGRTVVATEGSWGEAAKGGARAPGPLDAVLARVDRAASLWSASVAETDHRRWDLALDARFDGTHLDVRGSSIPPSGAADQAALEMKVPVAFAAALPAGALRGAFSGVVAAIAAVGGGSWTGK